jgi:hypothetical protein
VEELVGNGRFMSLTFLSYLPLNITFLYSAFIFFLFSYCLGATLATEFLSSLSPVFFVHGFKGVTAWLWMWLAIRMIKKTTGSFLWSVDM